VAIISVSDEIAEQVHELTRGRARRVLTFTPQYRRSSFAGVRAPDEPRSTFRVLYVGRIERNKGVFDVLEVARRFAAEGTAGVEFDLCGAGSALRALRKAIDAAGLSRVVRCHGHCDYRTMAEMYSRSHAVIVPTTTDFIEGFNKVVAEGVLAGRPVITSSVCPALALVRGAVVEVPPDDVAGYQEAIRQLRDDPALYQAKRAACLAAQEQFYHPPGGWAATLKAVLAPLDPRATPAGEGDTSTRWIANATAGKTS
jgi:glycosyltransferase involved in cell wall biosynthesis